MIYNQTVIVKNKPYFLLLSKRKNALTQFIMVFIKLFFIFRTQFLNPLLIQLPFEELWCYFLTILKHEINVSHFRAIAVNRHIIINSLAHLRQLTPHFSHCGA